MGIQINGNNDTITAIDGSITVGTDLTVPGVLTYDDVTNIDSVGVITARSGLNVTGGSVGIGTDNPGAKLEVATSVDGEATLATFKNTSKGGTNETVDIKLGLENTIASNVILRAGKEANHGSGAATDNFFAIHTTLDNASSEKLRITSSGNLGIGTDNPERTLSVAGNNPMIQIEGTGGSGKQWSIISSDDTTGANAASRGGNFVIYDDTSGGLGDVLTLTGIGGSMGLGVQNPSSLLEIDSGGSYGIRGDVAGRVGQSKRFIGKWTSGTTHNIAVVDGGTPRGQSRLGGFVVTFTYRSMYGFDGDGGGHGVRMLSGRVRDSGEWGFDTETNSAVGDTPVPTLQGTDNSDGTCTIQLVNPSSTHSFGEFNLIVWDCDIISPST